jgi:methyltransferase (TIGR00027 family)
VTDDVKTHGRNEPSVNKLDAPAGVGWTALIGAAARAGERKRPDALFDDPWASLFLEAAAGQEGQRVPRLGPGGDGSPSSAMWSLLDGFFVGRTPFIDAEVFDAQESGVDQFVLLGAGLDARAERLDFAPGSVVYEVDSGEVLTYKATVLARHGISNSRRVPVAADLGSEWVTHLVAAGFAPERPTCWVIEGLLIYLDDAAGQALLAQVHRAGPTGSRVVLDHISHRLSADAFSVDDPQDGRVLAEGTALMRSALGTDAGSWAAARGLRLTRLSDVATELRAHGRSTPVMLDRANPQHILGWLVSGVTSTK